MRGSSSDAVVARPAAALVKQPLLDWEFAIEEFEPGTFRSIPEKRSIILLMDAATSQTPFGLTRNFIMPCVID